MPCGPSPQTCRLVESLLASETSGTAALALDIRAASRELPPATPSDAQLHWMPSEAGAGPGAGAWGAEDGGPPLSSSASRMEGGAPLSGSPSRAELGAGRAVTLGLNRSTTPGAGGTVSVLPACIGRECSIGLSRVYAMVALGLRFGTQNSQW